MLGYECMNVRTSQAAIYFSYLLDIKICTICQYNGKFCCGCKKLWDLTNNPGLTFWSAIPGASTMFYVFFKCYEFR